MPYHATNNTMTQVHHVIPRHHGGTDDPSNLVELTFNDHLEAHRQLTITNPDCKGCEYAWRLMNGSSRQEVASMGGALNRGVPKSEEHRKKIADAQRGKPRPYARKPKSESTKKKLSERQIGEKNHNWGKKASAETRAKMSAAHIGKHHGGRPPGYEHTQNTLAKMKAKATGRKRQYREDGSWFWVHSSGINTPAT